VKDENHFWYLLARMLTGEATLEQSNDLNKILLADAELQKKAAVITGFWKLQAEPNENNKAAWEKLSVRIKNDESNANKK